MVQQEFVFDDEETRVAQPKESFLWNARKREFLGRDGASWAKVSFFYAIFYTCLASFFVGMLAVFASFMPRDTPTYFGDSSTMNRVGFNGFPNPGLGFRPMIDVEDHVILYDPLTIDNPNDGYLRHVNNLKHFLNKKYNSEAPCSDEVCSFNYEKTFKDTPCTLANSFGYQTQRPCVLVKLNKIISWAPQPTADRKNFVSIKCDGETSVDKDNLIAVFYHSEGSLNSTVEGRLDAKYYPYFNQAGYRAPFVFVQFEVKPNTLVNIECKANATNIDTDDRLNRRGMTKFSLYVGKTA